MEQDGPPELQDFQTELKDFKQTHKPQTTSAVQDYTLPNVRHVENQEKKTQMIKQINKQVQNIQKKVQESKPVELKKDAGFGGMKKGFFGSSSEPKTNKPKVIQVKPPNKGQNPLQIKEVQDAMKVNDYLNNTRQQWMDNNFLDNVSSNQKVSKLFSNPEYMQAIDMFQKNPQQAMAKYGGNKELMQCFQQFCKMMGMQFTKLAQDSKAKNKN